MRTSSSVSGDLDGSGKRRVLATFSSATTCCCPPCLRPPHAMLRSQAGPACGCLVDGHPERPSHVAEGHVVPQQNGSHTPPRLASLQMTAVGSTF